MFYVLVVFRDADSSSDYSVLRIVIAFGFLIALVTVLYTKIPLMLPKVLSIYKINGGLSYQDFRKNAGSNSRKRESGIISYHLKPEDVLGNIVSKYIALDKETQVAMCIKHIELWKSLMLDAEIPDREETDGGAGASNRFGVPSARNSLVSIVGGRRLNSVSNAVIAHSPAPQMM